MEAAVLRARGQSEARLALATAEAEAIRKISGALPPADAAMYLLGVKYLEALPLLTQGKGSTVFLPVEASGVMGAIGGIKELLARNADPGAVPSVPKQIPPAPPKTGER
jgi:regulator of protease activity HflC (stomatin/prohibitin superfamily)